ncbi:vanillate O-demethylase ferredoxin subunit [Sphaerotilus hippei]|uniref:Vanillate O-demethylase ferredoxin subunit n=2 Tax=Sphaerotilus hippei TaxID=744406 RepID=A0A318HDJ1_9BURK|nr:vanillate O-demethylase ferredoxin subunit [Sphaerotilus hippei]
MVAQDICALELVAALGDALPAFAAGAHIDLYLPGGWVRQYSLCNPPGETSRYLIAVLRDPASRGGSAAVHEQLHPGDLLTISTPRNLFALRPGAGPTTPPRLLLAGGIGLTPLLAMAQALHEADEPFTLHVATRSAARTPFRELLLAGRLAPHVQLHHDDGPATQRLDLDRVLTSPPTHAQLYLCGPGGFIAAATHTARRHGWSEAQIVVESFGIRPSPSTDSTDMPFELELAHSRRVVPVAPGQTAVQALAAVGVTVPVSCEQGICGTCVLPVLAGEPDHRDQYLTPQERADNRCFTPCCSRAKSTRLVVAL